VLETVVLLVGRTGAVALAPQITAPAPFGVFHDVRWLLVFHRSWISFALEALALVVFRGAVLSVTIRAAWPRDGLPPPPVQAIVVQSLVFTVLAALLLVPFASLLFALAIAPVSWLFFAGLPGAVIVGLLIHSGAVRPRWWREVPTVRSLAWTALTFVVLTLAGAALVVCPRPLAPAVAAAAGVFNAWAWVGIVRAIARQPAKHFRPVAPAGIAILACAAAAGIVIGMAGHGQASRFRQAARQAPPTGRPVLVATGFGSGWSGHGSGDALPGFATSRFSYRGLDETGRPLPYDSGDTHRSIPQLVAQMAQQVDQLHHVSGSKVDIVAESEGSVIAEVYAASRRDIPVNRIVLLSPLVRPGRVAFPTRGRQGWGVGTGWVLRGVSAGIGRLSDLDVAPDSPFMRSLIDAAPTLRDLLACRPADIDELALFPLADAVVSPHATAVSIRDSVVPAFHGGLLSDRTVRRAVALGLERGRLPSLTIWTATERFVSVASAAWQSPTLPLALGWPTAAPTDCEARRAPLADVARAAADRPRVERDRGHQP
jgi:hypothetical protein